MKNSNDNSFGFGIIASIAIIILGFIIDSWIALEMYQHWITPLSDNLPELTIVNMMEIKLFIDFLFSKLGNLKFSNNDD